jgi:molybdopterin synthase catalytic subunit
MAKILYFGWARDLAGCDHDDLTLTDGMPLESLWDRLVERHPELARCRPTARVAIDMEYARAGSLVGDDAEIAIIPPVAGG